jgi:predicted DCC family thiol-disulfide oxidoreductase YuxK
MDGNPVILYDGLCNLCNSSVDFVLRRDTTGRFRFAAFQSGAGQSLIRFCPTEQPLGKTIILIQAGRCYTRSDAILGILRLLPGAWSLLGGLRLVPGLLRDWTYNLVSRNRYKLFGRRDVCRMSLDGFEDRFLE